MLLRLQDRVGWGIGRLVLGGMRLLGRRGTALPGVIVEKLAPGMLTRLIGDRPVIAITGTNGKTSTAAALRSIMRASGAVVVGNDAGSNLMRGIIGSLLAAGRGTIRDAKWFVLEVEEATLPRLVGRFHVVPRVVVVTNLFRDQLDAYGELAHTAALIHGALRALPATSTVLLTADDPTVLGLRADVRAHVMTIGLDRRHAHSTTTLSDAADAIFCPTCEAPLHYEAVFYSHLGVYRCPEGHCERPVTPDVTIWREGEAVAVRRNASILLATPPSTPLYMVYNYGAAMAVASLLGVTDDVIAEGIANVPATFGRAETFSHDGIDGQLLLTKNPAGTNAVIATILDQPVQGLWLLLNDGIADGRDVSWIWDVDWELLRDFAGPIWIGGHRSWDLALRLKYAGFDVSRLIVTTDLADAWNQITAAAPRRLAILPTYTALLEVHRFLEDKDLVKGWK